MRDRLHQPWGHGKSTGPVRQTGQADRVHAARQPVDVQAQFAGGVWLGSGGVGKRLHGFHESAIGRLSHFVNVYTLMCLNPNLIKRL